MTGSARPDTADAAGTIRSTRPVRGTIAARVATAVAACVLTLAALALAGCGSKTAGLSPAPAAVPTASFPITVTDDASRTITLKAAPKRIVSLAPAGTEILFALDQGDRVVGVTSYDDYPSQVASITKVGDFAGPNVEAVAAAKPDLIIATSGVQSDVVAKLEALGATVVVLDPQSLEGVYRDIESIGKLTGSSAKAAQVVGGMKAEVTTVQKSVADSPTVTTFLEIAQNPLFTAGTGTLSSELITLAGGKNVVTQPGYVSYSVEQLIKADPQVYLATKGSMSDPKAVDTRPGYRQLTAVKDGRVVILDDNLVSRGGPRIVEGLKQIAAGLHPGAVEGQ